MKFSFNFYCKYCKNNVTIFSEADSSSDVYVDRECPECNGILPAEIHEKATEEYINTLVNRAEYLGAD